MMTFWLSDVARCGAVVARLLRDSGLTQARIAQWLNWRVAQCCALVPYLYTQGSYLIACMYIVHIH
jgi:hypothetical protein